MNIKHLETFLYIVRLGSFRAAAEKLHTTQPAISARIASLEQGLNSKLFERTKAKVKITSAGLKLINYAEKMVQLNHDIEFAFRDSDAYEGVIRLGAAETIVHTWLPTLINKLHQEYPKVTLELIVDTTSALRDGLVSRDIDVALLMGPLSDPTMTSQNLCEYPLAWIASPKLALPKRRLSLEDLARVPILTYPRQTRPNASIRNLFRAPNLPDTRINGIGSLLTMIKLTLDGFGICVVSPNIIQNELRSGSLIALSTNVALPNLQFTITYPPDSPDPLIGLIEDMALKIAQSET